MPKRLPPPLPQLPPLFMQLVRKQPGAALDAKGTLFSDSRTGGAAVFEVRKPKQG